jgi:hypothetical protein
VDIDAAGRVSPPYRKPLARKERQVSGADFEVNHVALPPASMRPHPAEPALAVLENPLVIPPTR